MNSVVVIPTLNRPEMLALSLKRIMQADNRPESIRIFVDYAPEDVLTEVDYVRDAYCPTARISHAREHVYAPSGCWNILNALKAGYETGKELIFLIEEDVMVYPDYFTWNFEKFRQGGDHFATCGRLRIEHSSDYYTNPGACFHRDRLGEVIPHINDSFFLDRRGYMDGVFGVMDEASDLDDGLIRRVIRQKSARVLYPESPKVAHQGFHYYNKLVQFKIPEGHISERVESSSRLLARVSPLDRYSKDFEPFRPAGQL